MKEIVVVAGGGSGIGYAVAQKFAAQGNIVVIADIAGERLEDVCSALRKDYNNEVWSCGVDVAREAEVREFCLRVREKYQTCDVLVNCAGAFRNGMIHESDETDFDLMFGVNVKGMYHMMKHLVPLMLDKQKGAVVNIASVSGINGDYNAPLYSASKAAVIGLTKAAALDYAAQGVRINAVSPCATKTPMFLNGSTQGVVDSFLDAIPDHKLGLPEQIADAVVFLCSDQALHIIGQNIAVDGGLSAWNGQPKQDKEECKPEFGSTLK